MPHRVRVGILVDTLEERAWVASMLQRIMDSDYASVDLIIVNQPETTESRFFHRLIRRWRQIPARVVSRFLNWFRLRLMERGSLEPDAFANADLSVALSGVPTLRVAPERKKFSDYICDEDLAEIRSYDLDVLIRLGFRVLRGGILTSAKSGIWSYHHGDNLVNRGGPAGFWEVMLNQPVTGCVLQVLSEDLDGGLVISRTWSSTNSDSVTANNNERYWTGSMLLPRALKELSVLGKERFQEQLEQHNQDPVFYSERLYREPTNFELAVLLGRKLFWKVRKKIRSLFFFEQWGLLFKYGDSLATSMWRFREILPPKDRFWADPFVVERDAKHYVFLEEYPFADQKGHIAWAQLSADGFMGDPERVIVEDWHLSYPFVFQHEDQDFMLAEAAKSRAVPLYRCKEFPNKWVFVKNLLTDIAAVDPTLIKRDQRWYLFVNVAEQRGGSSWDELFIYMADDLLDGEWTPHPMNPVVSDVRTSRPAGKIFTFNGNLYRPSQNCAGRYGYGMSINRIEVLTPTEYEERQVTTVTPSWSRRVLGVHTLSYANGVTLSDALFRRSKYW